MSLKEKFNMVAAEPTLALGAIWPATKLAMGGAMVGLTFGLLLPIDWIANGALSMVAEDAALPVGGTTLLATLCAGFFGGWGFFDHVEKGVEQRKDASAPKP